MPRLTVAQALVRFLAVQYSERDGERHRFFAGCFGIFGHGNVAGLGQALMQHADLLRYHQARNEQAMVHTAAAYARMTDRLSTFACTTSIGPGATNMVTGAAGATINRLPVLLLPGDTFATRVAEPVLQQLEVPYAGDVSVNDCLRPVSRYFDRIHRPEQLVEAALRAMRVLTDPAETGAVTVALPQDVQAEAYDWPSSFLEPRVWPVRRPAPSPSEISEAAEAIRSARRPLIIAGGGVIYSRACRALSELVEATGIPVGETQAGKGALPFGHPGALGAIGVTGTTAANAAAHEADVVIGIGTRYSDFTTASRSLFASGTRFVNINVAVPDAVKHAGLAVVADAREALTSLQVALRGWRVDPSYEDAVAALSHQWDGEVDAVTTADERDLPTQPQIIAAVNAAAGERGVVVCAAGSMPGELHKLWRPRDPKQYHVEYGYSCMGYEIAGGLGVKMAAPDREVFVLVGDGSYLMMSAEIATAVAEGVKLVVVIVDNRGFGSIGGLSETVGAPRFGTWYRRRDPGTGLLDGDDLPTDLAANAASLGATVIRASTLESLCAALDQAVQADGTTAIVVGADPFAPAPDSGAWWDVPVAEVSELDATRAAREAYAKQRQEQRSYL